MRDRLKQALVDLMMIPGLSGHEDRVRRAIRADLEAAGLATRTDMLGNLIATVEGEADAPSVMVFTHMDQLGFVVRAIEPDGLVRVERLGGVPERALPSQAVLIMVGEGRDVPGVIANKSHHATKPEEKYTVAACRDLFIDTGHGSAEALAAAGVRIGSPVVYLPRVLELGEGRIAGTSIDDRAGCAVLMEVARALAGSEPWPTIHLVFSVQEEFNLRGALTAAQALKPDAAIQIDIMLTADTPDMAGEGEVRLGGGPGISLYSFHGRGTLNGVIPHPAMVHLFEDAAAGEALSLQRSARVGVLTDLSYVQLVGSGVASIDVGFPMRYSHSSLEVCDLADLESLTRLILAALGRIDEGFS
ncbi:MAG: M42 family metallopeptidase, partial [Rhodobiaceae bacterium]|nr:M42 family metallopeptidase [Rhodobiaceae bacterium]